MDDLRTAISGWLNPQLIGELLLSWSGRIVAAAVIFLIGRFVARLLSEWFSRAVQRVGMDRTLARFFANLIYIGMLLFVAVTAVGTLGVNTLNFVALLGAAGLAIGLALKDSLSNFSSGAGTIQNFTAERTRRIEFFVWISYDGVTSEALNLIRDLLSADKRVLTAPAPAVVVHELGPNGVCIAVRAWAASAELGAVRSDMLERVKTALEERGFSIPYQRMRVEQLAGAK